MLYFFAFCVLFSWFGVSIIASDVVCAATRLFVGCKEERKLVDFDILDIENEYVGYKVEMKFNAL